MDLLHLWIYKSCSKYFLSKNLLLTFISHWFLSNFFAACISKPLWNSCGYFLSSRSLQNPLQSFCIIHTCFLSTCSLLLSPVVSSQPYLTDGAAAFEIIGCSFLFETVSALGHENIISFFFSLNCWVSFFFFFPLDPSWLCDLKYWSISGVVFRSFLCL